MNTTTVNISFQSNLLAEIDRVAQAESRSRSELLRESARLYLDRKQRWADIFELGSALAKRNKITDLDIAKEISAYRRNKGLKK